MILDWCYEYVSQNILKMLSLCFYFPHLCCSVYVWWIVCIHWYESSSSGRITTVSKIVTIIFFFQSSEIRVRYIQFLANFCQYFDEFVHPLLYSNSQSIYYIQICSNLTINNTYAGSNERKNGLKKLVDVCLRYSVQSE